MVSHLLIHRHAVSMAIILSFYGLKIWGSKKLFVIEINLTWWIKISSYKMPLFLDRKEHKNAHILNTHMHLLLGNRKYIYESLSNQWTKKISLTRREDIEFQVF